MNISSTLSMNIALNAHMADNSKTCTIQFPEYYYRLLTHLKDFYFRKIEQEAY